jgi:site-specific DNA recombinase
VEFEDRPMSHDPYDQLLLQNRGAVSEYERSLIAEWMRRGRRQNYQAGGLLPWTRAPYGYRVDPARPRDPAGVRLEPVEAAVVAELFSCYPQERRSLKVVTKQITDLGVPTPGGGTRWNQATIRGIFTNRSTPERSTSGGVVTPKHMDGTRRWFPLVGEDIPKPLRRSGSL